MIDCEVPIELECWMLRWGIMPPGHFRKVPDIVWPKEKSKLESKGWVPSYEGEEPPF